MNIYQLYNSPEQPAMISPFFFIYDLWNPYSYVIVKKILKSEKADVVHINNFRGLSISIFSAVNSLKIPLIFTIHDYSMVCLMSTLLNSSENICTNPTRLCKIYVKIQKLIVDNKPGMVTAPSQFIIDKLKETGLFKGTKTLKFPLGIELKSIKTAKEYNIINVLYVGGLSWHKGVHILINAFNSLDYKNIRLHIIGKGKNEDEIRKLTSSDKRIIYHGFVLDKDLKGLYQKANVTVVPSIWYDNSPMVIYESLMHGSPVIGSRIGGIPELVEEGYNGFLFEAGNVGELKKIFENILHDTPQLQRLEEGAYESSKKYDINEHIRNLEKIYRDIQR